ncbi:hypothetical protein D044_1571B, partial [Vibrio parahaemolyticus EKP-026]
LYNFARTM